MKELVSLVIRYPRDLDNISITFKADKDKLESFTRLFFNIELYF